MNAVGEDIKRANDELRKLPERPKLEEPKSCALAVRETESLLLRPMVLAHHRDGVRLRRGQQKRFTE